MSLFESTHTVPIRRMRRTLPLTLDGDFGLVEGEAWWFDGDEIIVWCPQRLATGATLDVRVDLGAADTHVTLRVRVEDLVTRPGTRVDRGYLHSGRFAFFRPEDRRRLAMRLAQIDTSLARSLLEAAPEETPPAANAASPGSLRDRLASARASELREQARERAVARVRERVTAPAPPEPAPPVSTVDAVFAPGDPMAVLVRFSDAREVAAWTRVHGDRVHLLLAPAPGVRAGTRLLAVIELPDRVHVQVGASVTVHLRHGTQIVSDSLGPGDRALFERLLREGGGG